MIKSRYNKTDNLRKT